MAGRSALEGVVTGAPDPAFWAQQRVFLTGHTGFKGGWLALWLQQLGATVHGYALAPNTDPSLFGSARVGEAGESEIGDIRDGEALKRSLTAFAPTVVLHLAAQPLVRYSYEAPVETYATNVMGVVHLLEAVRACPSAKAALIVTSDKCYENREIIWPYRETDAMGGRDPYSNSKGCAELVAASYFWSYFAKGSCGLASVRAGNVIGGGDWSKDRLFPDLLTAFARGEPAIVRRPDAIRPWQHVLEPLSGYLLAAERIFGGGQTLPDAWNFGPEVEGSVPVGEIIAIAKRTWGGSADYEIRVDPNAVHEATLLTLDATKARRELGWRPQWNLRATVEQTVAWYRAFYAGQDPRSITLSQIDQYTAASRAPLEPAA